MCVGGVDCENCVVAKSVVHVQSNYRHCNVHYIYRLNHVMSFIREFEETGCALNNLKGGAEFKWSVRTDETVLRVEEEYSKKDQVIQFLSSLKNLTLLATTYYITKFSDSIYRCFLTRYKFFNNEWSRQSWSMCWIRSRESLYSEQHLLYRWGPFVFNGIVK
jgi:hypothetical protein